MRPGAQTAKPNPYIRDNDRNIPITPFFRQDNSGIAIVEKKQKSGILAAVGEMLNTKGQPIQAATPEQEEAQKQNRQLIARRRLWANNALGNAAVSLG